MHKGLRRLRGALGMGLTWAVAWAFAGILIGVSSLLLPGLPWDAFFAVFDAPLPALAVPGFVGGILFAGVLGVAGRRRRFEQLSVPFVAGAGAAGGFLLSLVPGVMVAMQLASADGAHMGVWTLTAVISLPFTLLSALSATGSLLLARSGSHRATMAGDAAAPVLAKSGVGPRELDAAGTTPTRSALAHPTVRARADLRDEADL